MFAVISVGAAAEWDPGSRSSPRAPDSPRLAQVAGEHARVQPQSHVPPREPGSRYPWWGHTRVAACRSRAACTASYWGFKGSGQHKRRRGCSHTWLVCKWRHNGAWQGSYHRQQIHSRALARAWLAVRSPRLPSRAAPGTWRLWSASAAAAAFWEAPKEAASGPACGSAANN